MIEYGIVLLAFALGFSLARASTCTVAATNRFVMNGKADWFFGLVVAVSWSGMTLLFLTVFLPDFGAMPQDFVIGWQLVLGAGVIGLGALLNKACFIGSVAKIGIGDFSYILTFVGLAASLPVSQIPALSEFVHTTPIENANRHSGALFWIMLTIFIVICAISVWRLIKHKSQVKLALSVMGITAAMIYAAQPGWSYQHMLEEMVLHKRFSSGYIIEMTVAALFLGAIISSELKNRFNPHFSSWKPSMMNFAGGFLMGLGAKAVPGGNDTLLLWDIPGFALHGLVAYGIMIAVVAMMIATMKRLGVAM
ncbi:MAG: YeeE/YedE thiosulfate transporter family protein [Hyphomicrobiales bacterium]